MYPSLVKHEEIGRWWALVVGRDYVHAIGTTDCFVSRDVVRVADLMGHEDRGDALEVAHLDDLVGDRRRDDRIESNSWVVKKQRARLGGHGARDRHHDLGAAGPTTYIVDGKELGKLDSDDELPPIPPYVDDWTVVSVHAITEPVTLHGLTPHLHLRGKSMKYTLIWPDGREEVLLSVPRYDFNWQVYYELESPKRIPRGSKVIVTTLFDNSLKNPYNPAPQNTVYWSDQSWDEMYAPQVRITLDERDLRRAATTSQRQQQ